MAKSHIITIGGGKGGVGKSTFAVNYAITTAIDSKQKVLLIDLDRKGCGDTSLIIGSKPVKTLLDMTNHNGKLMPNHLPKYIATHKSGIHYMPGVSDPDQMDLLGDSENLDKTLKSLMGFYHYIIIDMGSDLHAANVKALELCSLIYIVTLPEIIVLRHTKIIIEKIQNMMFPAEMIKVVVNRFSQKKGISPKLIQTSVKRQIVAVIPEDETTAVSSLAKAQPFVVSASRSEMTRSYFSLARTVAEHKLLDKLATLKKPSDASVKLRKGGSGGEKKKDGLIVFDRSELKGEKAGNPWDALKQLIHQQLVQTMDLKTLDTETGKDSKKKAVLREKTKTVVVELLNKQDHAFKSRDETQKLVKEILDEALELGPIQDLLNDDSVSEIMVNRKDQIFVERNGKLVLSSQTFSGTAQLLGTIERIVAPLGRRIDEKTPYVDARLPDGSRVHSIIPPLAVQGPMITIRKFAKERITYKNLIGFDSMTAEMADFLRSCIEAHLNIIISGGTGSGKTTLLNVMASFIPEGERILTVEDAAELQLPQEHWGRLETRPANMEGKGAVTIRDLVKNTLRMRPDRIVVGECRSGEALDMLQAMNTGHDGSMTTVHSNSPRDCISRLETLVMMAGMDLPAKAIREQIASAVDIVIQQTRLTDGSRKVTSITEIIGMQGEVVTMQEIFAFKQTGMDKNRKIQGKFVATGFIPKFVDELEKQGISIPRGIFSVS